MRTLKKWSKRFFVAIVASIGLTVLGVFILTLIYPAPSKVVRYKKDASFNLPDAENLLIEHVTIIDIRTGASLREKCLLIRQGKIQKIAHSGSIIPSVDTKVVDGAGKYVVPGFVNMHAHIISEQSNPAALLNLMLANGITGFRQMGGSDVLLDLYRKDSLPIAANQPALLAMPGAILMPTNAPNSAEARVAIAHQKQIQADFIKIGQVSPQVFFDVLAYVKKENIPALGHVPGDVLVEEASNAGILSIEHLGLSYGGLLACSPLKHSLVKAAPKISTFIEMKIPAFLDGVIKKLINKMLLNPQANISEDEYKRLRKIIETYDEQLAINSAKLFARNRTWQVPTFVRLRAGMLAFLPEYQKASTHKYINSGELKLWRDVNETYNERLTPEIKQLLIDTYDKELHLAKLYDSLGVKMLIGTDGGANNVPGFSMHNEFDEFAKAGISPLRILQMATLNAAEYLHKTSTMGTVEEGKIADLVLLDGNPVENVANLHKISAVLRNGYFYDKSALSALKTTVEHKIE